MCALTLVVKHWESRTLVSTAMLTYVSKHPDWMVSLARKRDLKGGIVEQPYEYPYTVLLNMMKMVNYLLHIFFYNFFKRGLALKCLVLTVA